MEQIWGDEVISGELIPRRMSSTSSLPAFRGLPAFRTRLAVPTNYPKGQSFIGYETEIVEIFRVQKNSPLTNWIKSTCWGSFTSLTLYVLSTWKAVYANVAQSVQELLLLLFPSIKYMSHMLEILYNYAGLPELKKKKTSWPKRLYKEKGQPEGVAPFSVAKNLLQEFQLSGSEFGSNGSWPWALLFFESMRREGARKISKYQAFLGADESSLPMSGERKGISKFCVEVMEVFGGFWRLMNAFCPRSPKRESSRKIEHSQLKVLKELVEQFKVTTALENRNFNSQCFAIFHHLIVPACWTSPSWAINFFLSSTVKQRKDNSPPPPKIYRSISCSNMVSIKYPPSLKQT